MFKMYENGIKDHNLGDNDEYILIPMDIMLDL